MGSSAKLSLPLNFVRNGQGGVQQLAEEDGDSGADDVDPQDAIDDAQGEVDDAKQRVIDDAKKLHDIAQAIKEEQSNMAAAQQDNDLRKQAGEDAQQAAIDKVRWTRSQDVVLA